MRGGYVTRVLERGLDEICCNAESLQPDLSGRGARDDPALRGEENRAHALESARRGTSRPSLGNDD